VVINLKVYNKKITQIYKSKQAI